MRGDALSARAVLALALPAAGSAALVLVHRAVDMAWLKTLGEDATAALSVGMISIWLFSAVGALVGTGLTALVARYVGAARPEGAAYVASQGLRWAAALGVLAGVVGYGLAPWIYRASHAAPGVEAAGTLYTRLYWGGGALILAQLAADAVFRAHGDARVPLRIGLLSVGLNVALDPLLIFGLGPLPALGVGGAALAHVLSYGAGLALSLRALRARGFLRAERPPDPVLRLQPGTRLGAPGLLGLDVAVFRRLTRVGVPLAVSSVLFNAIYLVLHRLADRADGPAAQAGLGIGHNGEGVAFVLGIGWSAAAASLVGRSLGAGRPEEAARYAWGAVRQCAALCGLWALVLLAAAEPIAGLFTESPRALAHGAAYLRIVALCLPFQALELVLDGAFGGAGLTVPPLLISGTFSLLRIPLAAWAVLELGWGPAGLFAVISLTAALRGLACAAWFARGTWKTRAV